LNQVCLQLVAPLIKSKPKALHRHVVPPITLKLSPRAPRRCVDAAQEWIITVAVSFLDPSWSLCRVEFPFSSLMEASWSPQQEELPDVPIVFDYWSGRLEQE
jgi:hypothetical protein